MIEFTFNNGLVTFKCTIGINKVNAIISFIRDLETDTDEVKFSTNWLDSMITFSGGLPVVEFLELYKHLTDLDGASFFRWNLLSENKCDFILNSDKTITFNSNTFCNEVGKLLGFISTLHASEIKFTTNLTTFNTSFQGKWSAENFKKLFEYLTIRQTSYYSAPNTLRFVDGEEQRLIYFDPADETNKSSHGSKELAEPKWVIIKEWKKNANKCAVSFPENPKEVFRAFKRWFVKPLRLVGEKRFVYYDKEMCLLPEPILVIVKTKNVSRGEWWVYERNEIQPYRITYKWFLPPTSLSSETKPPTSLSSETEPPKHTLTAKRKHSEIDGWADLASSSESDDEADRSKKPRNGYGDVYRPEDGPPIFAVSES